jgi:hypothetical protein
MSPVVKHIEFDINIPCLYIDFLGHYLFDAQWFRVPNTTMFQHLSFLGKLAAMANYFFISENSSPDVRSELGLKTAAVIFASCSGTVCSTASPKSA